jgi:hypothetical protein
MFHEGRHKEVARQAYRPNDLVYVLEEGLELFLEGKRGLWKEGGKGHPDEAKQSPNLVMEGLGETLALLLLRLQDQTGLTSLQKQPPPGRLIKHRFILYNHYPQLS